MIHRRAGNGMYMQNPLLSTSNIFLPKTWKDAVRQCTHFFISDEDVNAAINKLSEYPLTQPQAEDDNSENTKKVIKELKNMKIMEVIKQLNTEYFSRGNCLISFYKKFKRRLVCPNCKTEHIFKNLSFYNNQGRFEGNCPKCGARRVTFTIKDEDLGDETPKLIFMDILNFKIVPNSFTGENMYYYDIPKKEKKFLKSTQDKDYLSTIPAIYFEALKANRRIAFNSDKIFHAKHATITGDTMFEGIGIPLIYPVLRTLFLKSLMRKTDEQIATERILGMEYVAPERGNKDGAGDLQVPYHVFKEQVRQAIQNFKKNANDIPIFPTPVRYGRIGGEGKMFLTINEQNILSEKIINGLQLPYEFIKGGLSWSASSVTLRMLENKFLNLREMNLAFINEFVVPKIITLKSMDDCTIKFKDFKMADDIQLRQLEEQLLDKEILSPSSFCDRYGYDYEKEQKQWVIDSRIRKSAALSIAKNRAMQNRVMVEEEVKSQIKANKMKSQLSMENEDGSYTISNINIDPGMIKQWKDMGFPMGELIKARDAELSRAQKEMELQMSMQAAMTQGQPEEGQEAAGGDMIPEIQAYIDEMSAQGMNPDEIVADLQSQEVPDEMIQEAFATMGADMDQEGPEEISTDQYNFVLSESVKMLGQGSPEEVANILMQTGMPEEGIQDIVNQAVLIRENVINLINREVPEDQIIQMFSEKGITSDVVSNITSEIENGFGYLEDEYLVKNFFSIVSDGDEQSYLEFFNEIKSVLNPEQLRLLINKLEIFNNVYNLMQKDLEKEEVLLRLQEIGIEPDEFVEKSMYYILNQSVEIPPMKKYEGMHVGTKPNAEIKPVPEFQPPTRKGL